MSRLYHLTLAQMASIRVTGNLQRIGYFFILFHAAGNLVIPDINIHLQLVQNFCVASLERTDGPLRVFGPSNTIS
ncbi:hypothetical protein M758_5G088900 [Ceratodon purpureus]|nr:hypothetical protein M758_5G088900 [Ceratodon purpureus]